MKVEQELLQSPSQTSMPVAWLSGNIMNNALYVCKFAICGHALWIILTVHQRCTCRQFQSAVTDEGQVMTSDLSNTCH